MKKKITPIVIGLLFCLIMLNSCHNNIPCPVYADVDICEKTGN